MPSDLRRSRSVRRGGAQCVGDVSHLQQDCQGEPAPAMRGRRSLRPVVTALCTVAVQLAGTGTGTLAAGAGNLLSANKGRLPSTVTVSLRGGDHGDWKREH